MKKIRCEVYDVENPDNRTFFVQANEVYGGKIYPTGVPIVLPEICVNVLKDAVIDTYVRNPETNKAERYVKPRFRVIELGEEKPKDEPKVEVKEEEIPEAIQEVKNKYGKR